jgi:4a-hydroxytetrahydrobiopterin dehydratase
MPYADPLSEEEIAAGLARLPGWERIGSEIRRTVKAADFRAAIALVDAVADAAEAANHHPDIEIRRYRRVTFTLSTHATGALTAKDLELAATIDELASEPPSAHR